MTTNPQPKDDKNMIFRNGEWIRKTGKPAMSDRPLPAPGDVDDMAWLEPVILSVIREWNELMMFGTKEPDALQKVGAKAKAAIATHIQREKELAVVEARCDEALYWTNLIVETEIYPTKNSMLCGETG